MATKVTKLIISNEKNKKISLQNYEFFKHPKNLLLLIFLSFFFSLTDLPLNAIRINSNLRRTLNTTATTYDVCERRNSLISCILYVRGEKRQ